MDLSTVDATAVIPALDGLVALALGPGAGVLAVGRGTAEALLAQPVRPLGESTELPPGRWVALRGDGDGMVQVWAWRDDGDGPPEGPPAPGEAATFCLHATWSQGALVEVTVTARDRTWSTLADGASGIGRDVPGGGPAAAVDWTDWPARARQIRADWDRQNHPAHGWTCSACAWQNEDEDAACAACRRPRLAVATPAGEGIEDGRSSASGAAGDGGAGEMPAILREGLLPSIAIGRVAVEVGSLLDGLIDGAAHDGRPAAFHHAARDPDRAQPDSGHDGTRAGKRICPVCGTTDATPGATACRRCGATLP